MTQCSFSFLIYLLLFLFFIFFVLEYEGQGLGRWAREHVTGGRWRKEEVGNEESYQRNWRDDRYRRELRLGPTSINIKDCAVVGIPRQWCYGAYFPVRNHPWRRNGRQKRKIAGRKRQSLSNEEKDFSLHVGPSHFF